MSNRKKKVAIYCRVARKDKISLKRQVQQIARFARGRGYSGGYIYRDNGVNGTTVDRPAFNRLNRDMLAGKIDVVVVKDLSRISRNYLLTCRWLDMAAALGVEVVSLCGSVGDTVSMKQLHELVLRFTPASGE